MFAEDGSGGAGGTSSATGGTGGTGGTVDAAPWGQAPDWEPTNMIAAGCKIDRLSKSRPTRRALAPALALALLWSANARAQSAPPRPGRVHAEIAVMSPGLDAGLYDQQGRFAFGCDAACEGDVPPGRYRLVVEHNSGGSSEETVELSHPSLVTVTARSNRALAGFILLGLGTGATVASIVVLEHDVNNQHGDVNTPVPPLAYWLVPVDLGLLVPGIVLLAVGDGPKIRVEPLDRAARRARAVHEARGERTPAAGTSRFRVGVLPAPSGAELGAQFVF